LKTRKLIIGYGNPLRGDDGIGWEIAECLRGLIRDESVTIMTVHQLTPELAEFISEAEVVIFIDASCEGGLPGTWGCDKIEAAPLTMNALGHHFTHLSLLAYARVIFESCPPAFIVSVVAESFENPHRLSPALQAVVPEIVRHIRELLFSRHSCGIANRSDSIGF
jgi:hydrogenase maturation protease